MAVPIFDGYRPGALAQLVGLHMAYYAPAWGFGCRFEAKVAAELAAFLDAFDPNLHLFRNAFDSNGVLLGSVSIDSSAETDDAAHLRWFIVSDAARGTGLGRRLLTDALSFARATGYRGVYLTTFPGLEAAKRLYLAAGFRLTNTAEADPWSGAVGWHRYDLIFHPA